MNIIKDSFKTIITSLIVLSLMGIAYAWTEPDSSPPAGNVSAPLNVSNAGQTKAGNLVVNALGISNSASNALSVTGGIVAGGDIKIGNSGASCSETNKGSVQYNSTSNELAYCNGTNWKTLDVKIPLPTVSLTSDYDRIPVGYSATLSWSSTDAVSCVAGNAWSGAKSTGGSESISPTSDSTYELVCTNATGSDTKSVTITVAQWQRVSDEGNSGESCNEWLARIGKKGFMDSPPKCTDDDGTGINKCAYYLKNYTGGDGQFCQSPDFKQAPYQGQEWEGIIYTIPEGSQTWTRR